jgi:hypothetical protein
MACRALIAGALVLLAATVSCAPPADEDVESGPGTVTEPEVPLELSVDHVDVAHGALRIRATMTDGSPDVSIRLGGDCEAREVGRGVATRQAFTWSLDEEELTDAFRCSLVVRARGRSEQGYVVAKAALEVSLTVTPADGDSEGLSDIPTDLAARAVLRGQPLRIDHRDFDVSISIAATALEGETTEEVEPENVEPENVEPENVEPENVEPGSAEPESAVEPEVAEESP